MIRPRSTSRLRASALACALASGVAFAADVLPNRHCADGVCMANVDARQSMEPCRDASSRLPFFAPYTLFLMSCITGKLVPGAENAALT